MTLQASPATPGPWVDSWAPLLSPSLSAIVGAGKRGVFRYVPLPRNPSDADISPVELANICGAGLGCCLVQHVRKGPSIGWSPNAHDPQEDAFTAAQWAARAEYPEGAHVFLRLEAVFATRVATIAYCVEWGRTMLAAHYRAGLMHGYAVPLGAVELYELPHFDCYWADTVNRAVSTRGNAIVQRSEAELPLGDVWVDLDDVAADAMGGLPMVATASHVA